MREQTNLNVYLCYSFCKNRYLTHFFSHSAQGIRRGRTRQQKNLIRANYSCPSPDTHIHTHPHTPTPPHTHTHPHPHPHTHILTQTKFIAPIIVGNMCAVVPRISPSPPLRSAWRISWQRDCRGIYSLCIGTAIVCVCVWPARGTEPRGLGL